MMWVSSGEKQKKNEQAKAESELLKQLESLFCKSLFEKIINTCAYFLIQMTCSETE